MLLTSLLHFIVQYSNDMKFKLYTRIFCRFFLVLFTFLSAFRLQVSSQIKLKDSEVVSLETIRAMKTHDKSCKISNNGSYLLLFYKSLLGIDSVKLEYREKKTSTTFNKCIDAEFSDDSHWAIFRLFHDSLKLIRISNGEQILLDSVSEYKVINSGGKNLVCYRSGNNFVLLNTHTRNRKIYENVESYQFNKKNDVLVVKTARGLIWSILGNGTDKLIDSSGQIFSLVFDNSGSSVAYIKNLVKDGKGFDQLMYYHDGMNCAAKKVDSTLLMKLGEGWILARQELCFNKLDDKVFFNLRRVADTLKALHKDDRLTIWSYKDGKLASQTENTVKDFFYSVLDLKTNKLLRLEDDFEFRRGLRAQSKLNFILTETSRHLDDYWWNKDASQTLNIRFSGNGIKREVVTLKNGLITDVSISKDERFVFWFNHLTKSFYCYDVSSDRSMNISANIPFPVYDSSADIINARNPFGLIEDCNNDRIFIYDKYDIWIVTLKDVSKPICLTNGYGRRNGIMLRFGLSSVDIKTNLLNNRHDALLVAFNTVNKDNGFYKINIERQSNPKLCTMGPYVYYFPPLFSGNGTITLGFSYPEKLKNSPYYVLNRQSVSTAPELFITKDFSHFAQLFSYQPHENISWITSELITWPLPDGNICQGIIYKPVAFDSKKKYPVIFDYYEKRSAELNLFYPLDFSENRLNIPYFVTNGYIVCVPDIYYKTGRPGEGALNSLTTVVNYLSKFSWVDTAHLGLQGHSFGGYETNYIITHTDIFAAACEAAGQANFISGYGQLVGLDYTGSGRQFVYEIYQSNMGCPPWKCPNLYIENSPIFFIDRINTPLLMMHNKGDKSVPFAQAIEMFNGMRREGKAVWLLEYTQGEHSVYGPDAEDYTLRMRQFFDHYLLGKLPPKWMHEMISSEQTIKSNSLELDSNYSPSGK